MSLSDIGPCEHRVKSSQYVLPWQHVKNDEPVKATCSCVAVPPVHLVVPCSRPATMTSLVQSLLCHDGLEELLLPSSYSDCIGESLLPSASHTSCTPHDQEWDAQQDHEKPSSLQKYLETTGYLPLPSDDATPLHVGLTCMPGLDGLLSLSQPQRHRGRKAQNTPKCRDEREGRGRGRRRAGLS